MADLPSASRFGDFMQWPGRDVLDADGERLGTVEMIFLDDETNQPEWVRITLAGDAPGLVMVPLALRGVRYRPVGATALLRRNLLIYGLGGLVAPFIGIKLIDLVVHNLLGA